tara:strand:+ start:165 stop:812 length:648 start_codon:yes stop_codon:yes gene_type:complete
MPEVKMNFITSDSDNEAEETEIENDESDVDKVPLGEDDLDTEVKPKVKAVISDDETNLDHIFVKTEKLTKKGVPRKKRPPMTEEHKEKLKAARVKAMASRKAKAQERKEVKSLDIEEKELLKKQKVKRVKQLKEEVEDENNVKPVVHREKGNTFSKADLEEAQLQAILNYEKIRKTRKKEKQVKNVKDKEEQDLRDKLTEAINPKKEWNPYAACY